MQHSRAHSNFRTEQSFVIVCVFMGVAAADTFDFIFGVVVSVVIMLP